MFSPLFTFACDVEYSARFCLFSVHRFVYPFARQTVKLYVEQSVGFLFTLCPLPPPPQAKMRLIVSFAFAARQRWWILFYLPNKTHHCIRWPVGIAAIKIYYTASRSHGISTEKSGGGLIKSAYIGYGVESVLRMFNV